MITCAKELARIASSQGIKVPKNLDSYDSKEFVAWHAFYCLHLGYEPPAQDTQIKEIERHALILASIPPEELYLFRMKDYIENGIRISYFKNTEDDTSDKEAKEEHAD